MSLSQSNEIAAPVADDLPAGHVGGEEGAHTGAHAVPRRILLGVYVLLLMFTAITVGVSTLDLGPLNIWVALFVAVIKGGLVAMFFMHLFWDSKFNGLVLVSALFFVALFIGLAMLDAHTYEPNLRPPLGLENVGITAISPEGEQGGADNGPTVGAILGLNESKQPKIMENDIKRNRLLDEVAATPGDPLVGEQLFTKQGCVACHTVRPSDPLKGPCLADVAKKYTRRELAENILDPNMKIAEGFATYHCKLNNDDVVEGFLARETADTLVLRNIAGQYFIVKKKDLAKKPKVLTTSPMPEGLTTTLTVKQFASIVSYLQAVGGVK
jgi:caa(3)-type oxidase subunit IV